jgi:hypothetical protein
MASAIRRRFQQRDQLVRPSGILLGSSHEVAVDRVLQGTARCFETGAHTRSQFAPRRRDRSHQPIAHHCARQSGLGCMHESLRTAWAPVVTEGRRRQSQIPPPWFQDGKRTRRTTSCDTSTREAERSTRLDTDYLPRHLRISSLRANSPELRNRSSTARTRSASRSDEDRSHGEDEAPGTGAPPQGRRPLARAGRKLSSRRYGRTRTTRAPRVVMRAERRLRRRNPS